MSVIATPPAIKLPSLASLTTAPTPKPAPAPEAKAGAVTPPPAEPEPKPGAVTQKDEAPILETDIMGSKPTGAAPIGTAKAASDFKAERLMGKKEKLDLAQIQAEYDQAKLQLTQRDLDLEKLRKDLADREKALEEEKKLAQTRSKDLEDLRTGYFEQNRATWNPLEDEQFQTASKTMIDRLRAKLPIRVPAGHDEQGQPKEARVFFDSILQQNGAHQGLANMLDTYALAKRNANEKGMTLAINAMGQFLGANVDMTDPDESKWRLLPPTGDTFKAIELALDEAAPFHVQRAERYAQVQKEGPALAKQQFDNRENGIRQALSSRVFLPPDVATKRLQADPNDGTALCAVLINQVPALKEMAEKKLNEFSQAFAAMGDKLFLPGLASANPAEIAAHRQLEAVTRQTISSGMEYAIVGAVIGPILSSVMAERDAAEERANAASILTNPGGGAGSKAGGAGDAPGGGAALATEIVTGR